MTKAALKQWSIVQNGTTTRDRVNPTELLNISTVGGPRPGGETAEDAFRYGDNKHLLDDKIRDGRARAYAYGEGRRRGSPHVDKGFDFKQFMADQLNGLMGKGDEPKEKEPSGTMYPREDEQLHPNKKPTQQQYGPNTKRQDELVY